MRPPKIQENSRKIEFSLFHKVKFGFSSIFLNFLEFSAHVHLTSQEVGEELSPNRKRINVNMLILLGFIYHRHNGLRFLLQVF